MKTEKGFKNLVKVDVVRNELEKAIEPVSRVEENPIENSNGRVLAQRILSPIDLPRHQTAAMDGYAVKAVDTHGSNRSSPRRLTLTGDCKKIEKEQACSVHTGDAIPGGADAVVMVEHTNEINNSTVEVFKPVGKLSNIRPIGEDVEKNEEVVSPNIKITPPHLSLLRSLGVEKIKVWEKPKIGIVPTGEELISPGNRLNRGEVFESNSLMVSNYVEKWGGVSFVRPVFSDKRDKIEQVLDWGLKLDLVVFIGGSSVGKRDRVVELVEELGEVYFHGIAVQPGKPMALGTISDKPVICLPGYPVSTLVDTLFFVKPALTKLTRIDHSNPPPRTLRLKTKITSRPGIQNVVRVKIENDWVIPIRTGGAGVLSSVTKSDGYVIVPEDSEGFERGRSISVFDWA